MRAVLGEVWKVVEEFYKNGKIYSERCLQAAIYHALKISRRLSENTDEKLNSPNPFSSNFHGTAQNCPIQLNNKPDWADRHPASRGDTVHYPGPDEH